MVIRFARRPDGEHEVTEGEAMPWVDEFVCAQKPTCEVLAKYGMLIQKSDSEDLNARFDVHPQIVRSMMLRDGAYYGKEITPTEFVNYMSIAVTGHSPDPPGVHTYSPGPLIHGPHSRTEPLTKKAGPRCKVAADGVTCKSGYPFEPNPYTRLGERGFVVYKRDEGDELVVPYNPWLVFEFGGHTNVEWAATSRFVDFALW